MKERIQKILSSRGVASRRYAEEMIVAGRITCNGQVCCLGDRADPEHDTILVDGSPLPPKAAYIYILLNKPRGYVTTLSDEKGRKNAAQLVAGCGRRVYPVGRLDMDSEGLLIFTNDGDFANALMHPRHEVRKTYRAYVKDFSEDALKQVGQPILLDGYRIRKPEASLIAQERGSAELEITIHEGRNRQIRRMCAAAGMQVERLIRVKEGDLLLGDLPAGRWRYLTEKEIEDLRSEVM